MFLFFFTKLLNSKIFFLIIIRFLDLNKLTYLFIHSIEDGWPKLFNSLDKKPTYVPKETSSSLDGLQFAYNFPSIKDNNLTKHLELFLSIKVFIDL